MYLRAFDREGQEGEKSNQFLRRRMYWMNSNQACFAFNGPARINLQEIEKISDVISNATYLPNNNNNNKGICNLLSLGPHDLERHRTQHYLFPLVETFLVLIEIVFEEDHPGSSSSRTNKKVKFLNGPFDQVVNQLNSQSFMFTDK